MAKKPTKTPGPTPVDAIKHKDARVNIPTQELRGFVAADEAAPPKILYPRDPSLDPQLVWKGKDEQDCEPLEVPAVPIYIQEKIHPQVIIENLRETARGGDGPSPQSPETGSGDEPSPPRREQLTLFASDFNGLK